MLLDRTLSHKVSRFKVALSRVYELVMAEVETGDVTLSRPRSELRLFVLALLGMYESDT